MKVLFLNDTGYQHNWGCRATCSVLKTLLIQAGHEIVGSVRVTQLAHAAQATHPMARQLAGVLGKRVVQHRWIKPVWSSLFESEDVVPQFFVEFDNFLQRSFKHNIILASRGLGQDKDLVATNINEALSACDAVLINGEGSLHGEGRIFRATMFVAHLAMHGYGKPVVIANHTLQADTPDAERMVSAIYPKLADYVVREPLSLQELSRLLPKVKPDALAPDAAFMLKPLSLDGLLNAAADPAFLNMSRPLDFSRPYIGLTLGSGFGRGLTLGEQVATARSLAAGLKSLGHQVLLLAHCSIEHKAFHLVAQTDGFPLLPLATPVDRVVSVLGNAAAIVGGRWHSAILGLTGGTPFIPLTANTKKMHGLCQLIGNPQIPFDVGSLAEQVEQIVAATEAVLAQGQGLRQKLAVKVESLVPQIPRHIEWFTKRE